MITLKKENIFNNSSFYIAETILTDFNTTYYHDHDFYEIFIVKSGTMNHIKNNSDILMYTSALSLVFPEDKHCFKKTSDTSARLINLAVSKNVFDTVISAYQGREGAAKKIQQLPCTVFLPSDFSQQLISRILWLEKETACFSHDFKEDLLQGILSDVLSALNYQNMNCQFPPQWLVSACNIMTKKENFIAGISQFVEVSGKSQEHLTRTMKKYFNQTPTSFINSLRLNFAAAKLSTTEESIIDIIYDCGFINISYFNKLFKEKYNVTPSQYRKNCKTIVPGMLSGK
jgi:AraC family cel operon transcriptional repressor